MKKAFICSLICPNGILGGGIYIDDTSIRYKTNKLTVDKKYKNLVFRPEDISELSWKWIVFPIATLQMKNVEKYSFIIFNKKRLDKSFTEFKPN